MVSDCATGLMLNNEWTVTQYHNILEAIREKTYFSGFFVIYTVGLHSPSVPNGGRLISTLVRRTPRLISSLNNLSTIDNGL